MKRTPIKKDVTSTSQSPSSDRTESNPPELNAFARRSFLKGLSMVGLSLSAGSLLSPAGKAQTATGPLSNGDAAILRLLGAIEILESDIWEQYWELGGTQDNEFAPATGGNTLYTNALTILDGDMP